MAAGATAHTHTNKRSNTGTADGKVDASDPVFFIATDLGGRRVATYRGTDAEPKERFAYHMPGTGAGGGGSAGAVGPIVRTRNSNDQWTSNWATKPGSMEHDERCFYTSDFRGNVSAIVSSGGNLIEQYRYSATGVPFGIPHGDVNADGLVGTPSGGGGGVAVAAFTASSNADYDQTEYLMMNNTYEVRADWNLDGVIDPADAAVVAGMNGVSTGRKVMSAAGVGNTFGLLGLELAKVTPVVAGSAQWDQRGPMATIKRSPATPPTGADTPSGIDVLTNDVPKDEPAPNNPDPGFLPTTNAAIECRQWQPRLWGCSGNGWIEHGSPTSGSYMWSYPNNQFWFPGESRRNPLRLHTKIGAYATHKSLVINASVRSYFDRFGLAYWSYQEVSVNYRATISCDRNHIPIRALGTAMPVATNTYTGIAIRVAWNTSMPPLEPILTAEISVDVALSSRGSLRIGPDALNFTFTGGALQATYNVGLCSWGCECCAWRSWFGRNQYSDSNYCRN